MPLVNINGVNLFYDLTGPEDAPVVLFSNSLGTTAEMWDAQVRALAPYYRVLRYDTRGHGRSSAGLGAASIRGLADDVVGLMHAVGVKQAHVVGLSLGGMTAMALAIHHPARVQSLTLLATSAHLPPPENWTSRAAGVRKNGLEPLVDTLLGRWFTPGFAARDPGRIYDLRRRFLACDPEGYARCCLAIAEMDQRADLPSIAAKTLVIAGAEDPVTPPDMMREVAKLIPGARYEEVPVSSHLLALEQAERVNELLLGFLAEAGAAPAPRDAFAAGLANRKAVLGVDHVQRALDKAGSFAAPWQDIITRNAWGEIWGDPALPWKTRSIVTLAITIALGREEEFKLHLRPALKNGLSLDELRALLKQAAIYAGVPAANGAFRWAEEVLGDEANPERIAK